MLKIQHLNPNWVELNQNKSEPWAWGWQSKYITFFNHPYTESKLGINKNDVFVTVYIEILYF